MFDKVLYQKNRKAGKRGQGEKHKTRGPIRRTLFSNRAMYRKRTIARIFTKPAIDGTKKGLSGKKRRVEQAKKDKEKS